MIQAPGMHLAELNVGRLSAPTDDPRVAEFMAAQARLDHLRTHGDRDHAFGWTYLNDAQLWKSHGCAQVAAE